MSAPKHLDASELAAFERATEIMASNLAFFRDETSEPNENDRLTAAHLAGGLWANGLLAKAKPITMQDVRLVAGEGKLAAHTVLDAVNAILRQRHALQPEGASQ